MSCAYGWCYKSKSGELYQKVTDLYNIMQERSVNHLNDGNSNKYLLKG